MSLLNLLKWKKDSPQYRLPSYCCEPTVYKIINNDNNPKYRCWYDNLIDVGCFDYKNKYPLLIQGCNWNSKHLYTFNNVIPAVGTKIKYVNIGWLITKLTERLIESPIIRMRKGFIKVNSFLINNISCYNFKLKKRQIYSQWFINDINISLAQVLNSMEQSDPLYTEIENHLLDVDILLI